jgi:CRP-like cAMP-binding protein
MQRSRIDTELGRVALFEGLSKQELRHVSVVTTRVDVPAGRVLIRQGAPGREFFVLIDGEAQVIRDHQLIATRGPGEYVGELALVDRRPRSATVIATTPVAIGVISRHDFRDLIHAVPDVAARIAATVTERQAHLGAETGDAARRELSLSAAGAST